MIINTFHSLLAHKENLVVFYPSIDGCATVRCSSPAANLGFPKTKDPTNYNPVISLLPSL